ncbi:MAG: hypothetical protein CME88_11630 [Hirschia sp.]|nr:hypothetical protein [Hirschia sp.]MBF19020.1 hypothetical protein [Hirschia sp.]|tara:strand:- start:5588 stop:8014 length:2427 start_codon:yes stop_codon:yes gene_type:complete
MRAVLTAILLAALPLTSITAQAQSTSSDIADAETAFDHAIGQAKRAVMSSPQDALRHATEAEALSEGDPIRAATAKWLQSEALKRMHRIADARTQVREALNVVEQGAENTKLHGDLLKALAGIAKSEGDYALALRSLHEAHDIYAEIEDPRSQAIVLQQTGSIYIDASQFEKAIDYYNRAGTIWNDDIALDLARLNNVANAEIELGRYKQAVEGYSAALAIAEKIDATQLRAQILTNIAHAQIGDEDYLTARSTLDQARALTQTEEGEGWALFVDGVDAELAFHLGDIDQARHLLERMFEGIPFDETDMLFSDFHELGYKIYSQIGDTDTALLHLKAFKRLDDEARNVAASANTALISAEFDFATQKLEIANLRAETLEQEVEIRESQARQRMVVFTSAGAIALILLVGLSASYVSIRRSRNKVRDANEQLSETNVELERALKVKSEFLATTSHEIRTPLNGIIGMTEVLLRGGKLDESTYDRLDAIHGSSQTMKAIVDDILDVSKMESGIVTVTPEEFALAPALKDIERVWRDSAANKGLSLSLTADDCPARITADPQRLRQIAFNLASNAIKFTEAGEVSISCHTDCGDEADWFILKVTDTGIGIPEDELERIFEPFHQVDGGTTRAQGGTGLGLTICRNFARAMGGDVTVTSTSGEGSEFTLRIPVGISAGKIGASTDINALAIEPNLMKQHLIKALFKDREETLVCCDTLEVTQQWLAENHPPVSIILSASSLGQSVGDGMAAMMALRKTAPETMIIVFCDCDWAQPPMMKLSGANKVVDRAFDPTALLGALADEDTENGVKTA